MKKQKKRNPVIAEAERKAYEKGLKVGFANGRAVGDAEGFERGTDHAVYVFAKKWEGLEKVKGIGPKIITILINHFGGEYFKKTGDKK